MDKDDRIYVAGHRGLVGSAVVRALEAQGYTNIVKQASYELDLTNQELVNLFFERNEIDYVILCAAKVGGILSNKTYPADFIHKNLLIQTNVIHSAYVHGVKKLCFLGSSCIYPKFCEQPIKEEYLLNGDLEPTNDAYAVAKIAGIKMCQAYRRQYGFDCISLMPTNLFGIGDNFDLQNSHVLPALISKFITAKHMSQKVTIWGTGTPKREFLYSDDLADAIIFLMNNYSSEEIINVGTGKDISILELATRIANIVGYNKSMIQLDASKPDGTPRKLLDVSKINNLGWQAKTSIDEGLKKTIDWYNNQ